ncbi:MAG: hypothetical protein ACFFD4_18255 [Candidatus Odinarchaeota archaeon]
MQDYSIESDKDEDPLNGDLEANFCTLKRVYSFSQTDFEELNRNHEHQERQRKKIIILLFTAVLSVYIPLVVTSRFIDLQAVYLMIADIFFFLTCVLTAGNYLQKSSPDYRPLIRKAAICTFLEELEGQLARDGIIHFTNFYETEHSFMMVLEKIGESALIVRNSRNGCKIVFEWYLNLSEMPFEWRLDILPPKNSRKQETPAKEVIVREQFMTTIQGFSIGEIQVADFDSMILKRYLNPLVSPLTKIAADFNLYITAEIVDEASRITIRVPRFTKITTVQMIVTRVNQDVIMKAIKFSQFIEKYHGGELKTGATMQA